MVDVAIVIAAVQCSACGTQITDVNQVQWGVCPRGEPYHPGDEVEWLCLPAGGVVPSFRLLRGQWNCGDPAVRDVLLKDPTYLGGPLQCPKCPARYEGVVVEVGGGRFRSARLYVAGEFADDVDVFEKLPDGSLRPRPEWFNLPVFPYEHDG